MISVFRRTVDRFADRPFVFDFGSEVTWAEADERTDAIAACFAARGLQAGETVGLCAPDSVELILAIIGAWKASLLPGLIDARTPEQNLPYFVEDVSAKVSAASGELATRLQAAGAKEVVDIAGLGEAGGMPGRISHRFDSPLYLSYTSGTTGPPKGAILLSGPLALGTACIADRLRLTQKDLLLATTPTSSSFQLVAALLPAIHSGAAVGLLAGHTAAEIWAKARERDASVLVAYPLTLGDVVDAPEAEAGKPPFRLALSGGSPLAPRLKREYRDRLGIPLCESYGQSEFGGFMALGRPEELGERGQSGFVGLSLPDRPAYVAGRDNSELKPGQVGEVVVPLGYFAGYANKEEEFKKATAGGVLHCGDLGLADIEGYLKVLGRTGEMQASLARGGFLRDAEDALYEHPEVRHGVVVEMADGGIEAFVERRKSGSTDPDGFNDFVAERVVKGLRPRRTTLLEAMPRTFSGKANRLFLSHQISGS